MLRPAFALLLVSVSAAALSAQSPDSATIASAYRDAGAREIVARAREHRRLTDRSITRYRTLATERVSIGVNALRRERLLFRREMAARIDWRRDGGATIDVLGGRQVIPMFVTGVQVADDGGDVQDLVFDPSGDRLFLGVMDSSFVFHPFGDESETHYRYASGDTTTIRLQDGRTIRLLAVEVSPRIRDVHHFEGSVWVDADSHAMVRAVVRLAEPYDLERDGDEDDTEDVPGFLKPIRGEVRFLTIEYGLWDLRWWLPRLIALDGQASVGSFLRVPFHFERAYSEYEVEGDPSLPRVPRVALDEAVLDSLRDACREQRREAREAGLLTRCECTDTGCFTIDITLADSTEMLTSPYLPASIYDDGSALMTAAELDELSSVLRRNMPGTPLALARPRFAWGWRESGLLRYNRVEGLSIGARATMDMGAAEASLTARLGVADLEPGVELAVSKATPFNRYDLGVYRRLAAMNPETKPLSFGNSVSSLLLGHDDGEYFRATGIELRRGPALGFDWYSARLYAEAERSVSAETRASLHHAIDGDHLFRPNRPADRADQFGVEVVLRHSRGLDPVAFRWGVDLRLTTEIGDYDFGRASVTARVGFPLPGPLLGSVEVSGGTSTGAVPVQSAWFLGGPQTVRGYPGAALTGNAFWRARAEIANSLPGARLALFGDAGWAGDRSSRRLAPEAWALGVGASFGDGILRMDLARALEGDIGWRLHLYIDGIL